MTRIQEYAFHARLMGCDAHVSIVTHDFEHAKTCYETALLVGQTTEERFSRFRIDSELSQINRGKRAHVSPEFYAALTTARALFRETGGAFNVLTQVRRRGYAKDFEHMDRDVHSAEIQNPNLNLEEVTMNDQTHEVVLLPGQELDFGGFMKGHAAEMMARSVGAVRGVVVNLGGDCYAIGRDVAEMLFQFSVYNPITNTYPHALPVEGAIATSGTYHRTWMLNGVPTHHIVGAGSGEDDLVSATVVHQYGGYADAYATTAVVLGCKAAVHFLDDKHLQYTLITKEGTIIRNM